MASGGAQLLALDGHRVRVGPWREHSNIGFVAPLNDGFNLTPDAIRCAVTVLGQQGFTEAISGAVPEPTVRPFIEAGFTVRERLHLLAHRLREIEPQQRGVTRRGRRRDRPEVLKTDNLAFDEFWKMDAMSLADTLSATPTSRLRVIGSPAHAYAVFGLADRQGYLQRLAVHPDRRGEGLARTLVLDGLAWCRRRGATEVYVNTQEHNSTALNLYRRVGFVSEPHWLVVLGATIGEV